MPLTLTIPNEILSAFPEGETEPDRLALESVVLELYRREAISAGRVAELLGLDRVEADRFLASHGVAGSITLEEHQRSSRTLSKLLNAAS